VEGIGNVMAYLGMSDRSEHEIPESMVYERSRWIRAPRDNGGFFFPAIGLGEVVRKGQVLGEIIDPLTDAAYPVTSNVTGEIIGMALSRPVLPGYALYHIAWHTPD
jgi:predicted deacylase